MPVAFRPEDVGLEPGAVPHRDVDVLLERHLVCRLGRLGLLARRDLLLHDTSPTAFVFPRSADRSRPIDRYGWSEHDASRGRNARLRVSPYLARGLDHQPELGDFARDIHGVAADTA